MAMDARSGNATSLTLPVATASGLHARGADTRPYRAKTKGKVERTIGFIRRSFLTGRTFLDKADADAQLATWLQEINRRRHGTHGELIHERLAQERPLLILPRAKDHARP